MVVATVLISFVFFPRNVAAQDQDMKDSSDRPFGLTTIPANSLVIPMDEKQLQTCTNPDVFNLKAYGLAQRLLQNNIPLFWVIQAGKTKDAIDFTATAERVFPSTIAAASVNFSGGPFVVPAAFVPAATPIINSFRLELEPAYPVDTVNPTNCDDDGAADVAVYRLTAAANADVRYTLNHRPKPAFGAANGGLGGAVHVELFNTALITEYVVVDDNTVNANTCITIATQPHSSSPDAFVDNYRTFVESGGNLLLQCASVTSFENSSPFGFFQTTAGWDIENTNSIFTYPNGDAPFSQFLGALEPDQNGTTEDWDLNTGSSLTNGTYFVAQNSGGGQTNRYAATVSKVGNVGREGGNVFAIGGHNYFRDNNNDVVFETDRYNGQRMILNALFVPVTRPLGCGLSAGNVTIRKVAVPLDGSGNAVFSFPFTATPNFGPTSFSLIDDNGGPGIDSQGSQPITSFGAGNAITVTEGAGPIGWTLSNVNCVETVLANSTQNSIGPATIIVEPGEVVTCTFTNTQLIPSAANVTVAGRVVTSDGMGIMRARVIMTDSEGSARSAVTNSFGYYRFDDVEVGQTLVFNVFSKQYQFSPRVVSLTDSIADLDFTAF